MIPYSMNAFSRDQQIEIELGLKANLPVEKYANPALSWEQMVVCRLGLMQGLDISSYAKPELTPTQMNIKRQLLYIEALTGIRG